MARMVKELSSFLDFSLIPLVEYFDIFKAYDNVFNDTTHSSKLSVL
jgi:hypothetical protein